MNHPANRTHPRIEVGPEFTTMFTSPWRTHVGTRIRNLSIGGCCIQLHHTEAGALFQGAQLPILHLNHAALPKHRLAGRVAWMRSLQEGHGDDQVLVGIEFQNPHPQFTKAIAAFVQGSPALP